MPVIVLDALLPSVSSGMPESNPISRRIFSCHMLGGVGDCSDWMVMLVVIIFQEMVDMAQVHQDAQFLLGLR